MALGRTLLATLLVAPMGCSNGAGSTPETPGVDVSQPIGIFVSSDSKSAIDSFVQSIEGVRVIETRDPAGIVDHGAGQVRIAVMTDLTCVECFRIDGADGRFVVHGGGVLGAQYGLAQVFEELGYRFFHPKLSHAPAKLTSSVSADLLGRTVSPELTRRGLHLHTLHPTEAYFDFWEPSDEGFEGAKRVIDWTVKNRGNYLEWAALKNLVDEDAAATWRDHTRRIVDEAHARGLTAGIAVQLFGASSLQDAFVLLKTADVSDPETRIRDQLHVVLDGIAFDRVSLNLGELVGVAPDDVIDKVNIVAQSLSEIAPKAELDATVDVGGSAKLHVQYMGADYLASFLVQFADPRAVPRVHTVMYYDLFEDTGGAYSQDDFSLQRQLIVDRLASGLPVVHAPESSHWLGFDDSVPMYLPLYMRSRFVDLQSLRTAAVAEGGAGPDAAVEFSSGWEWGYWQNDYAALRMGFALPGAWDETVREMWRPFGAPGGALADQITLLGETLHDGLITQRLAPYLAGSDDLLDLAAKNGVVTSPSRATFDSIVAMSGDDRAAFRTNVIEPLRVLEEATAAARDSANASGADASDPFVAELLDGFAITAARARFARAIFAAVTNLGDGNGDGGELSEADAALDEGRAVVARRHAALMDGSSDRLVVGSTPNSTSYSYGYLFMADTLCYWARERTQAGNLAAGTSVAVPPCLQ